MEVETTLNDDLSLGGYRRGAEDQKKLIIKILKSKETKGWKKKEILEFLEKL